MSSSSSGRAPRFFGVFALAAAALFAYGPALRGSFLWDDVEDIPQNTLLRMPAPEAMRLIWSGQRTLDYYPLKATVQWIQWHLWGAQTPGYHLTNLALHVLSAALFWRLLEKLSVRPAWAFLGSLAFLVDPLAVQSVAWICELKDTLSVCLLLLSAHAFVDFEQRGRGGSLAASVAWFGAAMLAKSAVVMYPVALLVFCWARHPPRTWLRWVRRVAPFFAISLALGVVTLGLQQHRALGGADEVGLAGPLMRLGMSGRALAFYFRRTLWPFAPLPIYRWIPADRWAAGLWSWLALLAGALGLRGLVAVRPQAGPWARGALAAMAWWVALLAPVLGFWTISFMRFTWVMDHFAYASLLGPLGLAAAGGAALASRGRTWRVLAAGIAFIFIGGCALSARSYARAFASDQALWTYAVDRDQNLWFAQGCLGLIEAGEHRYPAAEERLRRALQLHPAFPEAALGLADVLYQTGRTDDAVAEVRHALRLRPDFTLAELKWAWLLAQSGHPDQALPHADAALRSLAENADAHQVRADLLAQLTRWSEASEEYARAVALDPEDAAKHSNWGIVLANLGRIPDAIVQFQAAAALAPANPTYRRNLEAALQLRAQNR